MDKIDSSNSPPDRKGPPPRRDNSFVPIYGNDEKAYRTFGNPFPPYAAIQQRIQKRETQLAQRRHQQKHTSS